MYPAELRTRTLAAERTALDFAVTTVTTNCCPLIVVPPIRTVAAAKTNFTVAGRIQFPFSQGLYHTTKPVYPKSVPAKLRESGISITPSAFGWPEAGVTSISKAEASTGPSISQR